MDRRGLLPFIATAFFAVMISIFAFSLIDSIYHEPNHQQKDQDGKSKSNSDITNNVKNNIKGNKANVNNSIDNDLNNGDNSQIENNVSNDIEVNVDVNVTNKIKNKADSQDSSSGKKILGTMITAAITGITMAARVIRMARQMKMKSFGVLTLRASPQATCFPVYATILGPLKYGDVI
ncbi:hypothetical protein [Cytobacillus sp. NCCP-133]|uniref:hypothetical protein n=1 Tax=Cytobacillus sp. NCCP-133 TaxID=766848 RepID=UPI00222FB991|nr:hypothetical protein [Cytobacillus sp. NCCP-133]GLB60724.1 hypothetical protein NCCP133_28560 [Cytobacillus sp. NCCP-133]